MIASITNFLDSNYNTYTIGITIVFFLVLYKKEFYVRMKDSKMRIIYFGLGITSLISFSIYVFDLINLGFVFGYIILYFFLGNLVPLLILVILIVFLCNENLYNKIISSRIKWWLYIFLIINCIIYSIKFFSLFLV